MSKNKKRKKKGKKKKPAKRNLVRLGLILSGKGKFSKKQTISKDRRVGKQGSKNKQREYLEEQEKDG
jgi:hypothetical protein